MPLTRDEVERINADIERTRVFRPRLGLEREYGAEMGEINIERYKQLGGRCCLFCGSRHLERGRWNLFGEQPMEPTQSVKCQSCGRTWVNQYGIERVVMTYENTVPQDSPVTVDWNFTPSLGTASFLDFRVESDRVNENVGLIFDANDEPY